MFFKNRKLRSRTCNCQLQYLFVSQKAHVLLDTASKCSCATRLGYTHWYEPIGHCPNSKQCGAPPTPSLELCRQAPSPGDPSQHKTFSFLFLCFILFRESSKGKTSVLFRRVLPVRKWDSYGARHKQGPKMDSTLAGTQ
jgi:hypothetical protein